MSSMQKDIPRKTQSEPLLSGRRRRGADPAGDGDLAAEQQALSERGPRAGYHTEQVSDRTIGLSAVQPNALAKSSLFESDPLMRNRPGA